MSQTNVIGLSVPWDGSAALNMAARCWFLVTVVGQWAFLTYLVGFYGRTIVTGNPAQWNLNRMLPRGYVAADPHWDLSFGAHVMLAAVIAFGGTLQLIPQIRARASAFHRWNGRVFMLTAIGGSLTGLWMVWMRGADLGGGGLLGPLSVSVDALLIIAFAAIAWSRIRLGRIESHRRWALRLFMVANGVWFLRLGVFGWYVLTGGAGMNNSGTGLMNVFFEFADYLLPLAVLELYLRARDAGNFSVRIAAAATTFASTAYMAVGIFALTMVQLTLVTKL
jgi:hypothetical protein